MKPRLITLLLCLVLTGFSCVRTVQEEFEDVPIKPVINSILEEGKPLRVYVSLSRKLDKKPLSFVDSAIVKLYEGTRFLETLDYKENGIYQSEHLPTQEKNYIIEVDIKGFPQNRIGVKLPLKEKIISVEHINTAGFDSEGYLCSGLHIRFTNTPHLKQYFYIKVDYFPDYYNNYTSKAKRSSAGFIQITDPVLLNEGFVLNDGFLPILVFNNEKIQDTAYTLNVQYTTSYNERIGGIMRNGIYPLYIELLSIDSAYYHYLKSVLLYEKGRLQLNIGEVFSPYQVFSNIPHGYGIVAAHTTHKQDTLFPVFDR